MTLIIKKVQSYSYSKLPINSKTKMKTTNTNNSKPKQLYKVVNRFKQLTQASPLATGLTFKECVALRLRYSSHERGSLKFIKLIK